MVFGGKVAVYETLTFHMYARMNVTIEWESLAGERFGEWTRFEHLVKESLAN